MKPKKDVDTPTDRLLTPEEVAMRLGISLRSCRERIKRRQIPVVKVGRLNRIRESHVNAIIQSRPQKER